MSSIHGISGNNSVHKVVGPAIQRSTPTESAGEARPTGADRLELSGLSHLLTNLKKDGVRTELIASVKAQIEAGTYLTDEKMDVAIDRMMEDL
jgi:negative regulator of flagellin synthesis FlgM